METLNRVNAEPFAVLPPLMCSNKKKEKGNKQAKGPNISDEGSSLFHSSVRALKLIELLNGCF